MIKKNKPQEVRTEDLPSKGMLSPIAAYLRGGKEQKQIENDIVSFKDNAKHYATQAKDYARMAEEQADYAKAEEKKLKELPDESVTETEALTIFSQLSALPWVEAVLPNYPNAGWLTLRTRPNSLFCTFYDRIVNVPGVEVKEVLPKPMKVAYPQYYISVNALILKGELQRGHSMCKNGGLLFMDLVLPTAAADLMTKVSHYRYAHFASAGSGWSDICLGEHAAEVNSAFQKGIVAGFDAIAGYLQTAGSGHARRTKLKWAISLGYPPFYKVMYREKVEGEDLNAITTAYKEAHNAGKLKLA